METLSVVKVSDSVKDFFAGSPGKSVVKHQSVNPIAREWMDKLINPVLSLLSGIIWITITPMV